MAARCYELQGGGKLDLSSHWVRKETGVKDCKAATLGPRVFRRLLRDWTGWWHSSFLSRLLGIVSDSWGIDESLEPNAVAPFAHNTTPHLLSLGDAAPFRPNGEIVTFIPHSAHLYLPTHGCAQFGKVPKDWASSRRRVKLRCIVCWWNTQA